MFTPTVIGSGLAGYGFLTRTRDQQQGMLANSPQIARDTSATMERMKDVQSSDDLLDDRALLRVALGAFGLDEDINNRAFLKKILDSDLSDDKSLANRLADKRYLAFAKAFNFKGEDGPQMNAGKTADEVRAELANIRSADDLLNNPRLLQSTLARFGLESDAGNRFFLKQVLESNADDATSFARRLSNPAYADLARVFDLADKARDRESIYAFASTFEGKAAGIETVDDLFQEPDLLRAALGIFGLEADLDNKDFLRSVLESDIGDPASVANTEYDRRYLALAKAFDFNARAEATANGDPFTSTLEKFVESVSSRSAQVETAQDLFSDIGLMLDTFEFFDLPSRPDAAQFANKILTSDRDNPLSYLNLQLDQRYHAFADAFNLKTPPEGRVYPPGFADAIVQNYLDRQFEVRIGESDASMRVALAMERDLNDVVENALSNDARWFGVMSSKPLRTIFETVFQLPESFGALDLDRQLADFKARAESYFGTSEVADFIESDRMEELRRRYLVQSSIGTSAGGPENVVLSLLRGGL